MSQSLEAGGVLRIIVPDLEKFVFLYLKGDRNRFLSTFFTDIRGFKDEFSSRHKYMYDFFLLKEALVKADFKQIRKCKYQKGWLPDIEILDSQEDVSLYVAAQK